MVTLNNYLHMILVTAFMDYLLTNKMFLCRIEVFFTVKLRQVADINIEITFQKLRIYV